ncbi:MAG: CBS domain-containing protein [Desulfobulbaceae bacterium]|nr:CBS domain-containing protein [Desulfobulbaceae bacterium]
MLQAKDIMTREVITVQEKTLVRELAKILAERKISGMPVMDENDNMVGVVTENDLIDQAKKVHIPTVVGILDSFLFLESPEKLHKDLQKMAGIKAGDICCRKVITVEEETPLDEIATIMAEKKIHTLPVTRDGELVGVIGKTDIIRTLAQGN